MFFWIILKTSANVGDADLEDYLKDFQFILLLETT